MNRATYAFENSRPVQPERLRRDQLIAQGRVTAAEVDTVIELCDDPRLAFMSKATIAAWGHRPP